VRPACGFAGLCDGADKALNKRNGAARLRQVIVMATSPYGAVGVLTVTQVIGLRPLDSIISIPPLRFSISIGYEFDSGRRQSNRKSKSS
jgi:hypothetical protein